MNKIAVVSGTNRGIGYEIVKQLLATEEYTVVALTRKQALFEFEGLPKDNLVIKYCDVTNESDVRRLAKELKESYKAIDVLINNAGIISPNDGIEGTEFVVLRKVFDTNFFGPIALIKSLLSMLKRGKDSRIINVSSGMGANDDLFGNYAAYRLSKNALNAMSILLSDELRNTNVKVFSMCPGWVRTDMGGPNAHRSVEQGADTALWLAITDEAETGKFYRDREVIEW